jgi:hypothetical protein
MEVTLRHMTETQVAGGSTLLVRSRTMLHYWPSITIDHKHLRNTTPPLSFFTPSARSFPFFVHVTECTFFICFLLFMILFDLIFGPESGCDDIILRAAQFEFHCTAPLDATAAAVAQLQEYSFSSRL